MSAGWCCGCRGRSQKHVLIVSNASVLQGFAALRNGKKGPFHWMLLLSWMKDLTTNMYQGRSYGGIERQKSQKQRQHGSRKRRSWLKQRGQQTRGLPPRGFLSHKYRPSNFWRPSIFQILFKIATLKLYGFHFLYIPQNISHYENARTVSRLHLQLAPKTQRHQ